MSCFETNSDFNPSEYSENKRVKGVRENLAGPAPDSKVEARVTYDILTGAVFDCKSKAGVCRCGYTLMGWC